MLSVMFLRVGFVVFSVSCLPLKNYADNLSPFCLVFLLFFEVAQFTRPATLLPQIDLDKVKKRHEAQVIHRQG